MTDISKLCMVCLSELDENGVCPRCRKKTEFIQKAPCLPLKTIISGRYLIAKAVKHNGEGITYMAYDMKKETQVSVREFFPESIARREPDEISVSPAPGSEATFDECIHSFSSLWHKLLRLKGLSALISVSEVINANGTVYAVYAENEQITLRDYLLQTKEGFITWEKARILFMPVLSTLGTLHTSGIIHRGINPSAFVFSKEGKLKLTDFCTEQSRNLFGDITPEVFDGYTPYEQYNSSAQTGPWSDIYSFCSVLYRALIGTTPIDAKTRALNDQMMIPAKFAENLPPYVINALINGMQIKPDDRTNNVEQLRSDLSASPRAIGASAPVYVPEPQPMPRPQPAKPVSPGRTQPGATKPIPQAGKQPQRSAPKKQRSEAAEIAELKMNLEHEQKKKNTLIIVLSVILAILLFGIGFLISAIIDIKNPSSGKDESTVQSVMQMPNLVGMTLDQVMSNPDYRTFFMITPEERKDPNVENGVIIDQSIPANATATKGDKLTLYVSSGPKLIPMPDVTGLTYEQAEAELTKLGLKCKKTGKQNTGDEVSGTVAETIPAAKTEVKPGDEITVIVYVTPEVQTEVQQLPPQGGNSVEEFLSQHGNENNTAPQQ